MKIKKHNRHYSVLNDFIKTSVFVVLLTILSLAVFVHQKYRLFDQRIHSLLQKESVRAISIIKHSLSHIEYIALNSAVGIRQHNGNLGYITKVINGLCRHDHLIPWSSVGWLDVDGIIRVSDAVNRINTKHTIANEIRLGAGRQGPNIILATNNTRTGLSSEQTIIILSMAVLDQDSQYLGSLVVDVDVDDILKFIHTIITTTGLHFGIYHDNASIPEHLASSRHVFARGLNMPKSLAQGIDGYPFGILAVYDLGYSRKELYINFLQTFAIFATGCLTMVGLLYAIHSRNIRPIITLARIADMIARGKHDIEIPYYRAMEVNALARQLASVVRYINALEGMQNELSRKKIEAEIANKAKSEFMARVSHELKTPLNVIIAFSEIMKNQLMGSLNEKYIEYSSDVYESGKKLLSIISDILHISAAEAGTMKDKRELVNVVEVIKHVMNSLSVDIQKKSLQISIVQDAQIAESYISPTLTERVIWHIVSNSVKFSRPNGAIDITILTGVSKGYLTIIIKDEGIGMASSKLNVAYAAFDQLDGGLERRFEGMGVGLPLAKKILNLQNGSLDIVSKQNEGTVVRIKIPTAPKYCLEQVS